jgi:hypothetical protein
MLIHFLQYDRVYKIWIDFCAENGLNEFDAGHESVASCLSLVMSESGSISKVSMLSAAIANEHRIRMKISPTTHESISKLFRGFHLCHSKTRNPVLPITDDILRRLMNHLYQPAHGRDGLKASLVTWRTVWRIVIEYHTLGRFSDVATLQRSQVKFIETPALHLKILFKDGKNDLYNEGSERVVAADTRDPTYCPVQLTKNYFQFLGSSYTGYLVPASTPKFLPDPLKSVPYNGALEDLRSVFSLLGIQGRYGEHSGKRGATTAAAENGMSFPELKRLGGWRSDSVPPKYIDQSVETRLKLSNMLKKKL